MDFPKSVPGVGLVGGQFVDENPSIGLQGSLIPAAWGNAVTQELLNVIQAAGLTPDEAQTDQLLQAIRTLVPERSAFARVTGSLTLSATAFGIYALADGGAAATVTLPSTEDLVDDTELLLFANHTNTAAVQVKAAAGQTVQGPAALMGASTTAFMLPAGGDWVRLRSEKAQGRWVAVASYASARMDMLENRDRALFDGETLQSVMANRVIGATYTTGNRAREIAVAGIGGGGGWQLGIFIGADTEAAVRNSSGANGGVGVSLVIPKHTEYRVATLVGSGTVLSWKESKA